LDYIGETDVKNYQQTKRSDFDSISRKTLHSSRSDVIAANFNVDEKIKKDAQLELSKILESDGKNQKMSHIVPDKSDAEKMASPIAGILTADEKSVEAKEKFLREQAKSKKDLIEKRKRESAEKEHQLRLSQEKIRLEKQRKIEEDTLRKIQIEEAKKNAEEAEKRREEEDRQKKAKIMESARQKKIKAEKRNKQKILNKEKKISKRLARKERNKERKKFFFRILKKIKINFYRLLYYAVKIVKKYFINFIFYIAVILLMSMFAYMLFAISLYKIAPDNAYARKIESFIRVPAVVSSAGIIWYYDYIDYKRAIGANYGNLKLEILKMMMINDLSKKYGLKDMLYDDMLLELARKARFDDDINRVGISRITKIKELIKNDDDFSQIAAKYGDKLDKVSFENSLAAVSLYGENVGSLQIGDVSDIIYGNDGYYVFRRYKNGNDYALSYVFVANINLDDYLDQRVKGIKAWGFIE
jgi:hypothetical protein